MIEIPSRVTEPLTRNTLASLNSRVDGAITRETVFTLNTRKQQGIQQAAGTGRPQPVPQGRPVPPQPVPQGRPVPPQPVPQGRPVRPQPVPQTPPPAPVVPDMAMPVLQNPLRKGQKTALDPRNPVIRGIRACFGWNVKDGRCDIDASAFLTGASGKVQGDDWFVFYGQTESPDRSVVFASEGTVPDREIITVDFTSLSASVQKIIFVLTINEAFEQNLNFSMIKEAYIRILDGESGAELLSYRPEEYYPNVTSMTIGELYLHNGQWKFNPVGNGVHQDLAGQCAIYGVEIE